MGCCSSSCVDDDLIEVNFIYMYYNIWIRLNILINININIFVYLIY